MESINWIQILINYVKPELLVIVPILWYIGTKIKASRKVEDWAIPFMLMGMSVVFALSWIIVTEGFNSMAIWVGTMQGLAISVLEGQLYQYYKQIAHKRKADQKA